MNFKTFSGKLIKLLNGQVTALLLPNEWSPKSCSLQTFPNKFSRGEWDMEPSHRVAPPPTTSFSSQRVKHTSLLATPFANVLNTFPFVKRLAKTTM